MELVKDTGALGILVPVGTVKPWLAEDGGGLDCHVVTAGLTIKLAVEKVLGDSRDEGVCSIDDSTAVLYVALLLPEAVAHDGAELPKEMVVAVDAGFSAVEGELAPPYVVIWVNGLLTEYESLALSKEVGELSIETCDPETEVGARPLSWLVVLNVEASKTGLPKDAEIPPIVVDCKLGTADDGAPLLSGETGPIVVPVE